MSKEEARPIFIWASASAAKQHKATTIRWFSLLMTLRIDYKLALFVSMYINIKTHEHTYMFTAAWGERTILLARVNIVVYIYVNSGCYKLIMLKIYVFGLFFTWTHIFSEANISTNDVFIRLK